MEVVKTNIPDVLIIKPKVFEDDRGYFFESYNKEKFLQHGLDQNFVQ
ncbi:MAG: dTDP-4-dehydrorhamnose 3,5-epimerase family protein, partial [Bacteroidales bacterium]|nr:dTDP-4-dehydrorhamnose 3,5-epimerase family protein [Bacteroidales bacterium]MCF8308974.1 dTDP-4-dehydrorhamnose 3,5-epimerase family protein [Bacteroidales bacterium]